MKKVFALLIAVVLTSVGVYSFLNLQSPVTSTRQNAALTTTPIQNTTTSLIVPYWGLDTLYENSGYEELLYFGIEPTTQGINVKDAGYVGISRFLDFAQNGERKLLILRMIDSKRNFAIIENANNKKQVIAQTVSSAKENGFDGVVLDLEVQALPFDSVVTNITSFTKELSTASKKENLSFGMLMYGDVFYRLRPFDIEALSQSIDRLYIMAYDFHKAGGNPGPNFPLGNAKSYGYDMAQMISDFGQVIPKEKTTVVFGMFGYDWQVDTNGIATKTGIAKSLNEIQQFSASCANCQTTRDVESAETKVTYTTQDGSRHVLWYEDTESVAKKEAFLKTQGISSFSFWAHSYF